MFESDESCDESDATLIETVSVLIVPQIQVNREEEFRSR